MELNGLVNIKLIINQAILKNTKNCYFLSEKIIDQILEQVDYLERYMLALQDTYRKNVPELAELGNLPFWHDVKKHPKQYPTASERMAKRFDRPNLDLAQAIMIRDDKE